MKRIYFLICFLCFIGVSVSSQNLQDVVYLKNGSIVRGVIIEQIPNQSLKVQTKDGSVFVYNLSEVDKMTKEEEINTNSRNNFNSYSGNLYHVSIPPYKQIRMNYNPSMYFSQPGDPYNPTVSGLASWFIPGLGQMICGETNRGLGYLGGSIGCGLVYGIGAGVVANSYYSDGGMIIGSLLMIGGAVGVIAVNISSIVDAVKVAKVKNMYVNDMRSRTSSLHLEVTPYMEQISMNNEIVRPLGMTMRVKF